MQVEKFFIVMTSLFDIFGHIGGDDLYQSMPWWRNLCGWQKNAWKG
jgi:hypothetical protein